MPNYYNGYFPTQSNAFPTQMNVGPTQPTQQIQSGGFMVIPNEDMVRNYPVAPGNCVTFKIEGKPVVMEKSMGFSQLESPRIEKYRLVKEENEPIQKPSYEPHTEDFNAETINSTLDELKAENEAIWKEIEGIKNAQVKKTNTRRKDDGGDD